MKIKIAAGIVFVLAICFLVTIIIGKISNQRAFNSDPEENPSVPRVQRRLKPTSYNPASYNPALVEKVPSIDELNTDDQDLVYEQNLDERNVNEETNQEIDDAISFLKSFDEDLQEEVPLENSNPEELLELVKEGISFYDDLLYSGNADISIELRNYSGGRLDDSFAYLPNQESWEGSFSFSEHKIHYTVEGGAGLSNGSSKEIAYELAFDGEKVEQLSTRFGEAPLLEIGNDLSTSRYNPHLDPRYWGWNVNGMEDFSQLVDSFKIESVNMVRLNGNDVYHLKGRPSGEAMNVEIWVNPSRSYRPERFDFSVSSGDIEHRVTREFNLKEYAPDIWFPESATEVGRMVDMTTQTSQKTMQRDVWINNVSINPSISDSSFRIKRRRGLRVHDKRNNTEYNIE